MLRYPEYDEKNFVINSLDPYEKYCNTKRDDFLDISFKKSLSSLPKIKSFEIKPLPEIKPIINKSLLYDDFSRRPMLRPIFKPMGMNSAQWNFMSPPPGCIKF